MEEYLPPRHSQNETCLSLSDGYALNTSPVNLREVAGIIYDECNCSREKSSLLSAAPNGIFEDEAGKGELSRL